MLIMLKISLLKMKRKNNRNTNIMVKFDEDGYWLMVCYENGKVLKDFICQELVDDVLADMQKEEPNEKYKEDVALMCCVGCRIDEYRDKGYIADWFEEDEEDNIE
ncbi:MAG: hypothetical protein PHT02_00590 [Tissierellia bacterium]|nr:hypothetical protein [Tissierellia bacterium]